MSVKQLLLLVAMFGWASGCASMSKQEFFEHRMSGEIGKSIASSWYRDPDEKKALGDGKFEYIIRSRKSACVWAFIVDENKGVILSWHYISEPSVCGLDTAPTW